MRLLKPIVEEILLREGPLTADAINQEIRKVPTRKNFNKKQLLTNNKQLAQLLLRYDTIEKKDIEKVRYQNTSLREVSVWGLK